VHAPDHLLDAAACADLAAGCALMPWGDAEGARKTSGGARGNTRTRGDKGGGGPPPRVGGLGTHGALGKWVPPPPPVQSGHAASLTPY